ncbi:MAG: transcriptional regulator [Bacteroidetes bacterium]|nr:transcriptional regulator [Bacteroidota bacterium]
MDLLSGFDKAFENRVRLQIMSVLVVNEELEFNFLKELLKLSDGNLASHIKALEKENYVQVWKGYNGRKPLTKYSATGAGKLAFKKHLAAIENFINKQK